jgi:hypothetical protein
MINNRPFDRLRDRLFDRLRDRLRIILGVPELVEGHPVMYNKIAFIRF